VVYGGFDHAIGATAAKVDHGGSDVFARRRGVFAQQSGGHPDLTGLAIAALRDVQADQTATTLRPTASVSIASILVIAAPFSVSTVVMQHRVATPSTITVQAPHCAMPQPYFIPVRPSVSRKTQSSGVSDSTSTVWSAPLMFRSVVNSF
jgi:hypothetical protein